MASRGRDSLLSAVHNHACFPMARNMHDTGATELAVRPLRLHAVSARGQTEREQPVLKCSAMSDGMACVRSMTDRDAPARSRLTSHVEIPHKLTDVPQLDTSRHRSR